MLKPVPEHIPIDPRKFGSGPDPRWNFFRDQGQQNFDSRNIVYLNLNKNSTNYYYRKTGDTIEPLGKFTKIVMPPNQSQSLEYYIEFDRIYDSNNNPIKVNPTDELYYTDTEIDVNENNITNKIEKTKLDAAEETQDETVFRKTNDIPPIYQDFVKTIPIEEIEASNKTDFRKTNDIPPIYQDFVKTIPPNEKYTWTEMNEMVEREIRSVVGKMTDAIKEDIVGTLGVEDGYEQRHFYPGQSTIIPNNEDIHERLTFTVLNIFNTYLIKVLQSIVNDYKFKSGYKEHSKYARDYLQIATGKIDTASLRAQSPPTPNWFLSWVLQIIHDVPEYTELKKKYDKVYEYQFIGKSIEQIGYLLNMMANQDLTGTTFFHIHDYKEQSRLGYYLQKEPIVPLEHFGIFAGQNSGHHLKCKTPFYKDGKINKPFLKRFFTIFRDFYSFLIDEIDYDLPVKKGGKSRKRRIQKNKKTRNYKK
jgi:hypothetical protein